MTESDTEKLIRKIQGELSQQYRELGNLSKIGKECACAGGCPLNGNCAACVAWHRDHARNPLPYCLRDQEGVSFQKGDALRNVCPRT